jgi:hypothetical protein
MSTSTMPGTTRKRTTTRRRRLDGLYLGIFAIAVGVGLFFANRPVEEPAALPLPEFRPPELVLAVPFELPWAIVEFRERRAPALVLGGSMESVLVENRAALLESAVPADVEVSVQAVPIPSERHLASAID